MKKLKIGVVGLGRAFALMVPAFRDPRIELVAAVDPRQDARRQFEKDFGGRTFTALEGLCADPQIDVVYIATPHQFHAEQTVIACSSGKHVLVEKPMALKPADCRRMTDAATRNNVHLIVGHSHSFDAPILHARKLIDSGRYGAVKMVTAVNFTDFLYRPRRPEELDTARGGGAVFNQATHQVDVVRLLAGAKAKSVRAQTGAWDPTRPTEGAYSALVAFEGGVFANLVYSGYAHFDSDEFMGWIGEMGQKKDPDAYGLARKSLQGNELDLKANRNYGGPAFKSPEFTHHQHFGVVIASCEKADLRPSPEGVMIYADGEKQWQPLSLPRIPRVEVIDELYDAVVHRKPPLHSGVWATATIEICNAMLRSARLGKEVLFRGASILAR